MGIPERTRRRAIIAAAFFLVAAGIPNAVSEEPMPLPPEAPESLFDFQIGSSDVELFIAGTWEAAATVGLGYLVILDTGAIVPYPFPGIGSGFLFEQHPDLTISLRLEDRYFFETSIIEGYELNTFLLGYDGVYPETLRSVRIGNTDIDIGGYGYLSIPSAPPSSLGATARFETDTSILETLVRFEPSEQLGRVYIGGYEVLEEELEPAGYENRRFFVLPDSDVEDLAVYIETGRDDPSWVLQDTEGSRYRRAGSGDASISSDRGTVLFREPVKSRVIARYEKGGKPVGDPALGRSFLIGTSGSGGGVYPDTDADPVDFDWDLVGYFGTIDMANLRVSIGGKDYLVLCEREGFSPFAYLGGYRSSIPYPEESWALEVFLAPGPVSAVTAHLDTAIPPAEGILMVMSSGDDIRLPANRYPLAARYPELYGPDRELSPAYPSDRLYARALDPVDIYRISGYLGGSVQVTVNGTRVYDFSIADDGTVTLARSPGPADRVVITWRSPSSGTSAGDIIFGIGDRILLGERSSVESAIGLRWSIPGNYSEYAGRNTGGLTVSAGYDYLGDRLDARVTAGVSLVSPDTSGIFRIAGMEKGGMPIPIGTVYPAAPPDPDLDPGLTPGNRGALLYADYNLYGAGGNAVLQPYTWDPPADQRYLYEDGSFIGPYLASGDARADGDVVVLDYRLDGSRVWAGGQIPLGESADLSAMSGLSFLWKTEGDTTDIEIYLDIGAIDEDLDGDGFLDTEGSPFDSGFAFDDTALSGAVLTVTGGRGVHGNGAVDSEDTDGNGILDGEGTPYVVRFESSAADFTVPGSDWERVTLRFGAADRKKLAGVTAARFIVRYTGTGTADGRLVIAEPRFEGSPFIVEDSGGGMVYIRTVDDSAVSAPDATLADVFPETAAIFHPAGGGGKVLEIEWDGVTAPDGIAVRGFTEPVLLSSYRELVFYSKTGPFSAGNAEIEIVLADAAGKELTAAWPAAGDAGWSEYRLDFETMSVERNGAPVTARIEADSGMGKVLGISISVKGPENGILYIDEIHLAKARVDLGAGIDASVGYARTGTVLETGGFPLIANPSFRVSASAATPSFSGESSSGPRLGSVSASAAANADVAYISLETDARIGYGPSGTSIRGGHRMAFPSIESPVTFTDTFSATSDGDYGHRMVLDTVIPAVLSASAAAESRFLSGNLREEWTLSIRPLSNAIRGFLDIGAGASGTGLSALDPAYFRLWGMSVLEMTALEEGASSDRWASASGEVSIPGERIGVTAGAGLGYSIRGIEVRIQDTTASVSLSVPLRGAGGWSIVPEYRRTFDHSVPVPGNETFEDDFARLWESLSGQRYLLSAPFYDLGDPSLFSRFMSESLGSAGAEYESALSLTYRRRYGSYLRDLFVPSSVAAELTRRLVRDGDEAVQAYDSSLTVKTAALNLFGLAGAYPLVPWYATDELGSSFAVDLESTSSSGPVSGYAGADLYAVFTGTRDGSLNLGTSFRVSIPESRVDGTIEAGMAWGSDIRRPIDLPLISADREEKARTSHETKIEIGYGNGDAGERLIVRHESALVVPDTGKLSFFAGAGIESRGGGDSGQILFGCEIGLRAKVTF